MLVCILHRVISEVEENVPNYYMQLADHTSYVYNQIFHSRNVRIVAKARISFVRSVRQSARIRAVLTGRISVKFDTENSSEDLSRNPCLLKTW